VANTIRVNEPPEKGLPTLSAGYSLNRSGSGSPIGTGDDYSKDSKKIVIGQDGKICYDLI